MGPRNIVLAALLLIEIFTVELRWVLRLQVGRRPSKCLRITFLVLADVFCAAVRDRSRALTCDIVSKLALLLRCFLRFELFRVKVFDRAVVLEA